jgi:fatty-acyl-CoA synthase
MSSQISVDYLSTRDFAMRPRIWLTLMSQNKTTVSFSPPFGYELCAQRIRPADVEKFDLSNWRVAGVGAEPIRPEPLARFAEVLEPAGFDTSAFLPCYGMAECSLAVSFSPLSEGIKLDHVDARRLAENQKAVRVALNGSKVRTFVNCGPALPGYDAEVRDRDGNVLPERQVGTLYVKGPSVMSGYFGEEELTREVLSRDGWLNTGDLAYMDGSDIVVTGREKDMILINGRNIWPQDLEYLAESQPEVRSGDASAFSVPGADGIEQAVLVVECRVTDPEKRMDLVQRLKGMVSEELGIDCFIELVPRNTLPRTTSGKLSRSGARKDFLERVADGITEQPGDTGRIRELRKQAV